MTEIDEYFGLFYLIIITIFLEAFLVYDKMKCKTAQSYPGAVVVSS